jgi:hypothetical protein
METELAKIKEDCLRIVWYMRGGISYSESMMLTPDDRIIIGGIIKDNLETTKKSGLPFF